MLESRLHGMVHGAGKPPVPGIYSQATIYRRASSDHRRGSQRAIRASARADKIERIGFLRGARGRLLTDVVSIIDGQMCAVTTNVAELGDGILPKLLFHV